MYSYNINDIACLMTKDDDVDSIEDIKEISELFKKISNSDINCLMKKTDDNTESIEDIQKLSKLFKNIKCAETNFAADGNQSDHNVNNEENAFDVLSVSSSVEENELNDKRENEIDMVNGKSSLCDKKKLQTLSYDFLHSQSSKEKCYEVHMKNNNDFAENFGNTSNTKRDLKYPLNESTNNMKRSHKNANKKNLDFNSKTGQKKFLAKNTNYLKMEKTKRDHSVESNYDVFDLKEKQIKDFTKKFDNTLSSKNNRKYPIKENINNWKNGRKYFNNCDKLSFTNEYNKVNYKNMNSSNSKKTERDHSVESNYDTFELKESKSKNFVENLGNTSKRNSWKSNQKMSSFRRNSQEFCYKKSSGNYSRSSYSKQDDYGYCRRNSYDSSYSNREQKGYRRKFSKNNYECTAKGSSSTSCLRNDRENSVESNYDVFDVKEKQDKNFSKKHNNNNDSNLRSERKKTNDGGMYSSYMKKNNLEYFNEKRCDGSFQENRYKNDLKNTSSFSINDENYFDEIEANVFYAQVHKNPPEVIRNTSCVENKPYNRKNDQEFVSTMNYSNKTKSCEAADPSNRRNIEKYQNKKQHEPKAYVNKSNHNVTDICEINSVSNSNFYSKKKHTEDYVKENVDTNEFTKYMIFRRKLENSRHYRDRSRSPDGFIDPNKGFRLTEINGDLFSCDDEYSLVLCVTQDFRMKTEIAVEFKRRFGDVRELINQNKTVGEVAELKENKRYIFYLITKKLSHHKTNYYSMFTCLSSLKNRCKNLGIKKLAIPKIGFELDWLIWNKVKNMLNYIFQDFNILIIIYD